MISKELLSEVLKDKLKEEYNGSYDFICNGVVNLERNEVSSTLGFYDSELDFFINIYEFAYKCKEWANNLPSKRYQLYSGICPKSLNYSVCSIFSGAIEQTEEIIANSELEAIFSACQWILDNKGIK